MYASVPSFRLSRALPLAVALMASVACGDGGGSDHDDAAVSKGAEIVAARLCVTCHLSDLSGANVAYPGTQVFPPNLTPDVATGLGTWTDDEIITAILDGVDVDGRQLCAAMPVYGNMGMSEEDAAAVVAYLRSLPEVAHEVPEFISCRAGGS